MPDKWNRIKSGDERDSQSFDESFRLKKVGMYGWDGTNMTQLKVDELGILDGGAYAMNLQTDSGDANVQYLGKAAPGTATSAASWQIQKIDETTGTVITWADGNSSFDNVYDNRESLSYS